MSWADRVVGCKRLHLKSWNRDRKDGSKFSPGFGSVAKGLPTLYQNRSTPTLAPGHNSSSEKVISYLTSALR